MHNRCKQDEEKYTIVFNSYLISYRTFCSISIFNRISIEEVCAPFFSKQNIETLPIISVLRIRDILVRIRIRRCVPLTNGSGSADAYLQLTDPDPALDPSIFVSDLQDGN